MASALQLLKADQCLTEVPQAQIHQAMVVLAEELLVTAQQPTPAAWAVPEPRPYNNFFVEAREKVAGFMPNALGVQLAGAVKEAVREVLMAYRDRQLPVAAPGAVAGGQIAVRVNTAQELEEEAKFFTYTSSNGMVKVIRHGVSPNTWLYPHHWNKAAAEMGKAQAFAEWKAQKSRFFENASSTTINAVNECRSMNGI